MAATTDQMVVGDAVKHKPAIFTNDHKMGRNTKPYHSVANDKYGDFKKYCIGKWFDRY
jgi:hypothetical protein